MSTAIIWHNLINRSGILVAPAGFEPALTAYEAAVLTIKRKSSMVRLEGIEPTTFGLRIRCSAC